MVGALRTGMDEEREPIVALAGNPEGKVAPRGQLALFLVLRRLATRPSRAYHHVRRTRLVLSSAELRRRNHI